MEDDTDCQTTSSDGLLSCSDVSDQSSVEIPSSRQRRFYRIEYLRCKRLRAKGYRVPMPIKPWRFSEVNMDATPTACLSKEEIRRIKNRESAERSRKAVDDAILQAQRGILCARRQNSLLTVEHSYIMQMHNAKSSCGQVIGDYHDYSPLSIAWEDADSISISECTSEFSVMEPLADITMSDEDLEVLLNNLC